MVATSPASANPAAIQNAHCDPAVNAAGNDSPLATRWLKWLIETDDVIATPIAPPICCAVLMSPDARPASCASTPASAAIATGMNENGNANPTSRYPGRRSDQYDPSTGICVYQSIPAVIATKPAIMTGFGPTLVTRACATPAHRIAEPAVAMNVTPVRRADQPSTCWT